MFSYLASMIMLLNVIVPAIIPIQVMAQEATENVAQTVSIDAKKDDWEGIDPIEPSVEEFDESLIGNLHLHNDDEFLYFWVDANNIPNWGDDGHYLNLALQVNDEDSENSGNPWASKFNYSGMDNKPQYQLSFRIKNDTEVNGVQFSKANKEGFEKVLDSEDLEGAEFSVNREVGFEGKIPLEHLDLKNDDAVSVHAVLTGNNDGHGAFDVIPKVDENHIDPTTDGKENSDIQSTYTAPYTVVISEGVEVPETPVVPEEPKVPKVPEEPETPEEPGETEESKEDESEISDLPAIEEGHFRLHFEKLLHETPSQNGLWLWEDVETPSSSWPTDAMSFGEATKTEYGYAIDIPLAENPEKIGFLINSLQGASGQVDNMFVDILTPEMKEAWVTAEYEIFPYEPLKIENTIRVNYLGSDYEQLGLWTWGDVEAATDGWPSGAHDMASDGRYGAYYDLPIKADASLVQFKFLDKAGDAETANYSFDQFDHTQIFLRAGDDTIYTNPYFASEVGIVSAEIVAADQLEIGFHSLEGVTEEMIREELTLMNSDEDVDLTNYTITMDTERNVIILEGAFDFEQGAYKVIYNQREILVNVGWRLKDSLYAYDGELGLVFGEDGTPTLKFWSPSANNVNVILYDKNDQDEIVKNVEMTKGDRGVWAVELDDSTTGLSDVTGYFYHFEIDRGGEKVLALDPYARSMAQWDNEREGQNYIGKAAIVNPRDIGPDLDFANIEGFEKREDGIIYEVHVRDFTSDPTIADDLTSQFGTFAAFVEKLDYIEDLGATHVQLLPVMSYFFADEFNHHERMPEYAAGGTNYNWGYDPQSYFALTGMYSEDAADPAKRIEEFKNLINEIHKRGMGVILDVVYNHTARDYIFEDLEPNYYHFMEADGTPKTSFGGGRLGTTHEMARRVLVDSITYWVEEYKVDGFRFDMMGDHDAESIQKAYDEAAAINPNILMIGEGWVTYAGDDGDNVQPADQQWMKDTKAVGSFSDEMRNELKSGFGSEGEPRFLTGGARSVESIYNNLTANPGNFEADDPGDVVPYIAAHDNLTLHDVIAQSIKKDPKDHQQEIHERIRLGNLMVLTAQGTPFIHAGQEFGRTKQFRHPDFKNPVPADQIPDKITYMEDAEGNPFEYPYFVHDSYDSTDAVNKFDWNMATNTDAYPINTTTRAYTKGLIELRRSTDAFSKGTMAEIDDMVSFVRVPEIKKTDLAIVYRATDSAGDTYFILINSDDKERHLTIPFDLSDGEIIVDAETAGTTTIANPEGISVDGNEVVLDALSAAIIRVDELVPVEVESPSSVESPVINEDGTVTFSYEGDETTETVNVAGSFNGWDSTAFSMEKGEDDVWSVTVDVTPGVYEYKLVVNGDNWINDPANDIIAGNDGNNQLILPGLIIEGDKDVEPGATVTLTATYVNDEGEKEVVDADFALATEIAGVTIDGNTVTISEDISPASEIIIDATFDGDKATHTIFVVGEMYEYTINYMRPDGQQADWGLWLWTADVNGSAYAFGEESTGGYVQSTVSFASDKLNLITRLGNWESQEADRVITIPEGEKSVEVWIVGGNPEVYYSLDDVELLDQRYIELTYVRKDNDYEGWNLWVWGTGVKDDEILFDEITDKGAVVRIPVGYLTTEVGFKIRKGDWVEEDPFNEDRYIEIPIGEMISKVTINEGEADFFTVPTVDGPVLENGDATFFYRDPELFLASEMDKIEQVQLSITKEETADAGAFATFTRNIVELFRTNANTEVYDMTYDAVNEYYVHTIEDIEAGNYDYTYLVTIDGETEEVVDPYNTNEDGHSTLLFAQPTVTAETSINPKAISYNENAVVTIESEVSDDYELRAAYIDLTPVGGPERVAINTELMEHTIAVKNTIEPGVKTLNIVLVDEFGNRHNSTVDVEVKSRQIKDDADFDWDEARIYFMLTDRFSNSEKPEGMPSNELSESYHGGDFQGVINNLDYLEELGINTIWITPIVDNIDDGMEMANGDKRYGYHGYWAKDFTKIDENLGDKETFATLIDEAHDRGMKIMVDVVLNHAGYGMNNADQFEGMIRENPVATDDILGELDGLPDFKTEDPEVRKKIIQWQVDWIKELDKFTTKNNNTIDYFRVDTVKHVDNTTWNAFKNEITKVKPDFKMIGEWYGASVNSTGDQLRTGRMDSLLDFNFKGQAERFIKGNISQVEKELSDRNGKIDNTAMLGQFLSSHDEDGFLVARAKGDEGLFKVAAALQITAKGQPVIYYGEELGQSGLMHDDSVDRYYDENRYNLDWSIANDENDMLTHYKKLLNIREDYSDVFSKGTRQHIAGDDESGYSVFTRTYEDKQIFVGLNTNEEAVNSTFTVDLVAGTEVIDVYNDGTYVVAADGTVTIDIPGNADGGTVILVAVEPETPGVGGEEADGSDTDDSTEEDAATDSEEDAATDSEEDAATDSEEDAATDSEEDNLPLTGETNHLMVSIIGLVFIGSGVALAFTFKKDERKE